MLLCRVIEFEEFLFIKTFVKFDFKKKKSSSLVTDETNQPTKGFTDF